MPAASRSDPSRLEGAADPSGGKESPSRQTQREMSNKASFWQQKEINHCLTRTFLTEKLVAMKTGELKTRTVFASFPSVVIFSPSLSQRDVPARRKKRNVRLVHELSSKELLLKVGSRLPGKRFLKRSPQRDEERTVG